MVGTGEMCSISGPTGKSSKRMRNKGCPGLYSFRKETPDGGSRLKLEMQIEYLVLEKDFNNLID